MAVLWLGLAAVVAQAQPTSYSDFQGGPGRGLNVDFTWATSGNLTFWSRSSGGSDPLISWQQGDNAVIGVPNDGGAFTTTLGSATISVGSLSVETGTWTIAIGGNTLSLGATSTATAANVSMAGGSLSLAGNGMTAALGTFNHSGGTLDFGSSGANLLSFTGAAGTWTGTLNILNYISGSNTLRFGTSGSALDGTQLASISFNGVGAQIDGSGFVTPVPEPAAYAALLGAAACAAAGWKRSRRVVRS